MGNKEVVKSKLNPVNLIAGRFLFYFFYLPFGFMILNTLSFWIFDSYIIEAPILLDTIYVIGGMFMSLLHFLYSLVAFKPIALILGNLGDVFIGLLLLGSTYIEIVTTAWAWVIFLPFELVKLFTGLDLLYLNLSFEFFKYHVGVVVDIRTLLLELIKNIMEALTPNVGTLEYFRLKFTGEIIGFGSLNISSLFSISGISTAVKVFLSKKKDDGEFEEVLE